MPALIFPFVKLYAAGSTSASNESCFELLGTLLMNWTRGEGLKVTGWVCAQACKLVCSAALQWTSALPYTQLAGKGAQSLRLLAICRFIY